MSNRRDSFAKNASFEGILLQKLLAESSIFVHGIFSADGGTVLSKMFTELGSISFSRVEGVALLRTSKPRVQSSRGVRDVYTLRRRKGIIHQAVPGIRPAPLCTCTRKHRVRTRAGRLCTSTSISVPCNILYGCTGVTRVSSSPVHTSPGPIDRDKEILSACSP